MLLLLLILLIMIIIYIQTNATDKKENFWYYPNCMETAFGNTRCYPYYYPTRYYYPLFPWFYPNNYFYP